MGQILTVTVREGSRKMALAMGKATGPSLIITKRVRGWELAIECASLRALGWASGFCAAN